MEKKGEPGLQGDQKAQGVWERRTADRRYGQNQLFGSFRVDSGGPAVSRNDPTDSALAAIASILDQPAGRPLGGSRKPAEAAQAHLPEAQVPEVQVAELHVAEAQVAEAEIAGAEVAGTEVSRTPDAELPPSESQPAESQASEPEASDAQISD